jgi:hypothetical protein
VRNKVRGSGGKERYDFSQILLELILMCKFFDTAKINWTHSRHFYGPGDKTGVNSNGLRLGEQAYETIDELLKPFKKTLLNVESVSIMQSRILEGGKGDIMIPNLLMKEQLIIIFSKIG